MNIVIDRYYRIMFGGLLLGILGLAFYLGFLEGKQQMQTAVVLQCDADVLKKLAIPLTALATGDMTQIKNSSTATDQFVGSKNGTKYYTANCPSVAHIKPENYRWFANEQDAQLQGYTKGTC